MHLIIKDGNYLKTYESVTKRWWYERNKGWLFLSAFIALFSILQIIGFLRQDAPVTDDEFVANLFIMDVRFWCFFTFLAFIVIILWVYKRHKSLEKIHFMREFEKQVRKTDMVYDLNETRLRISYRHAVTEYGWAMFQKFHFVKGYLIIISNYYPINLVWIPLEKGSEHDLSEFVKIIKEKFKIEIVK